MSDQGSWWEPPQRGDQPADPWFWDADPPTQPLPHVPPPAASPASSVTPARPRRRRLAPWALVVALVVAAGLSAGSAALDSAKHPLTGVALPGVTPPASDASATHNGHKGTPPLPNKTQAPDPYLSVADVQSRVEPGVVIINATLGYQNAEAAGTGMVLSSDGEILTNNHVIDGATQITVTIVSTQQRYRASVLGTAVNQDIAVLQLEGASGLATVPLGNSDRVAAGQSVVALGNAGGSGSLSVVTGTVTATDKTITASDQNGTSSERLTGMIQVQAAIRAGDSGGPLANRAGKVVGMNTAASANSRFEADAIYGFAIPINRAVQVAAQIRSGDTSGGAVIGGRGYLGIQVQTADATAGPAGAEVIATTPGSPAADAGIQSGDVITYLNGTPVTSADELTRRLGDTKPGQQVNVGWVDAFGEAHSAQLTLISGPAD